MRARFISVLFLFTQVHHNDGDIRAAAAAVLSAQLTDEAWRTRMYLWLSHMPHLHSATLFKCLFLIRCDALPEPDAVVAVARVMQLLTTKSGMHIVMASSRKAQELLLGGMAVNLASGNPILMLTSLEFNRRYDARSLSLSTPRCLSSFISPTYGPVGLGPSFLQAACSQNEEALPLSPEEALR